ncbi:flagellar protein FlaG [Ketobacter sp.]
MDKETDEVIRQIPPEDVIQIAKSMGQGIEDALLGILVDSYA